ncbi:MAG TPA: OmpA family protein [Syntrophales bacterium]|nr:OmpA family protein [Syntrophales bacterium]
MSRRWFGVVLFLVAATLAVGCAAQKGVAVKAQDLNPKISGQQLIPKVENFLVILDGTASMADPYKGTTSKSSFAKGLASLMNQTIPDIPLNAGLRTFGDVSPWSFQKTALYYGMTRYTKPALEEAIDKVGTRGDSPLEVAIAAASDDLKSVKGRSALIIFSDGEDMTNAPVQAARKMKSIYGDRLCIYTVLTGNSPVGRKLLENVAAEGKCGFFVTGESIASSEGMADFVEKVFLTRKPRAAAPAPVVAPPPAPAVEEEKAAKAPAEAATVKAPERIALVIHFDTGKAVVKSKYCSEIERAAEFLKKNPDATALIEGHTDSVGTEAFNMELSQRRAEAVANILVQKYGIDKSRIKTAWYGFKKPVADNKTADGRQKNRRVEAIFETK